MAKDTTLLAFTGKLFGVYHDYFSVDPEYFPFRLCYNDTQTETATHSVHE